MPTLNIAQFFVCQFYAGCVKFYHRTKKFDTGYLRLTVVEMLNNHSSGTSSLRFRLTPVDSTILTPFFVSCKTIFLKSPVLATLKILSHQKRSRNTVR